MEHVQTRQPPAAFPKFKLHKELKDIVLSLVKLETFTTKMILAKLIAMLLSMNGTVEMTLLIVISNAQKTVTCSIMEPALMPQLPAAHHICKLLKELKDIASLTVRQEPFNMKITPAKLHVMLLFMNGPVGTIFFNVFFNALKTAIFLIMAHAQIP